LKGGIRTNNINYLPGKRGRTRNTAVEDKKDQVKHLYRGPLKKKENAIITEKNKIQKFRREAKQETLWEHHHAKQLPHEVTWP